MENETRAPSAGAMRAALEIVPRFAERADTDDVREAARIIDAETGLAEARDALRTIRDARDYHADHGEYPEGTLNDEQCFDDWAADVADLALAKIEGAEEAHRPDPEAEPLDLHVFRSDIDGALCVQIDGPHDDADLNDDTSPRMRVYLNDGMIYGEETGR